MRLIREMAITDIAAAFTVRTSTVENALTLRELEEEHQLTPETLADSMRASARGWVCEVGGEVVGFVMVDNDNGELTVLAVLPDHEGSGIGKALLAKAESGLVEMGHKEMWLLTTPDPTLRAYNLYTAYGWTPTGEIVGEDERFVKSAQAVTTLGDIYDR